jgi:hypothetical protein
MFLLAASGWLTYIYIYIYIYIYSPTLKVESNRDSSQEFWFTSVGLRPNIKTIPKTVPFWPYCNVS